MDGLTTWTGPKNPRYRGRVLADLPPANPTKICRCGLPLPSPAWHDCAKSLAWDAAVTMRLLRKVN